MNRELFFAADKEYRDAKFQGPWDVRTFCIEATLSTFCWLTLFMQKVRRTFCAFPANSFEIESYLVYWIFFKSILFQFKTSLNQIPFNSDSLY